MPKITVWIYTGFAGANHRDTVEVSDAEWEHLTAAERETQLDELAMEFLSNMVSCGAYVADEGEEP